MLNIETIDKFLIGVTATFLAVPKLKLSMSTNMEYMQVSGSNNYGYDYDE